MKISLEKSAIWCVIISSVLQRASSSMSCPVRHTIWRSGDLEAYLHPSPWTPGTTVVTHAPPKTPSSLFHLSESSYLGLMLGARAVGGLLCEHLGVRRCALVHKPECDPSVPASLKLLPLHRLDDKWRPHLAAEEDFQPYDPGYMTSKSGPRWGGPDLDAIKDRIRAKLELPEAPPDYTFGGDPAHPGLFSRIVRGEEQQWRVWEDEGHVAFLTPFPNTPGLTVVIPRHPHASDILRLQDEDYAALVRATRKVAALLERALGAHGVGLVFEGYEIDYAHAKLIPMVSPPGCRSPNRGRSDSEFFEAYPGFVSSADGPPASGASLEQIRDKIVKAESEKCVL